MSFIVTERLVSKIDTRHTAGVIEALLGLGEEDLNTYRRTWDLTFQYDQRASEGSATTFGEALERFALTTGLNESRTELFGNVKHRTGFDQPFEKLQEAKDVCEDIGRFVTGLPFEVGEDGRVKLSNESLTIFFRTHMVCRGLPVIESIPEALTQAATIFDVDWALMSAKEQELCDYNQKKKDAFLSCLEGPMMKAKREYNEIRDKVCNAVYYEARDWQSEEDWVAV